MASPHAASAPAEPSDDPIRRATLGRALLHLWPYMWPGDRADLKMSVVWSMLLLLAAKVATLTVPFTFKWAIDALNGVGSAPVQPDNWAMWLIVSPLAMTVAYGSVRVLMALLTQWRDGIFAKVAMHAVRRLAYRTFVHMHELSLRFHLERKTGGLISCARTRAQRHRGDGPACYSSARPHRSRGRSARSSAVVAIRLALRAGYTGDRGGLHGLHVSGDEVAD